jgi:glycosyltransferase involved in cell wall biosynthesis
MKKILVILATDRLSSPARLVVQVIEHCDHKRFSMLIGCTWQGVKEDSSEFFQELQRRKIPLRIFRQLRGLDPSPLLAAIKLVRKEKIDLIETHGYKACFIGLFLKIFSRKPWITVLHGHTAENLKMNFFSWLELRMARYADRIVTVSAEMRRRLILGGLPAGKTVTIHNAIDPSQFITAEQTITRTRFGVGKHEFLIGIVGRFSPEKGQDLFIKAFKLLALSNPQVKVIFIGEGPTEAEIRAMVHKYGLENRVVFAGYQPEILSFYQILDLIVMPSRSEGLPSVALEALFYRVPVVATAVGGTGEVIINEKTGLLVSPEDPEKLSAAIARMITDSSLQKSVAEAGFELISERFLPEARTRAFERLYENLEGDK